MDVYVRCGDSLSYYSQLFHVPLPLIVDANPTINPLELQAKQVIKIPGYGTEQYTIQRGDSIYAIAQKLNISSDAILLLNPQIRSDELQVGHILSIPVRVTWRVVDGKQDYNYHTMIQDIKKLQNIYPFLLSSSIGDTVLGKSIPGLFIGNGSKRVHVNASFHANEWITTAIVMTFLNDYVLALTNNGLIAELPALPLYAQTNLIMVPMVNPDGVDLVLNGPPEDEKVRRQVVEWNEGSMDFSGWKANINGVDLNDQFPAQWELEQERNAKKPGPRDYGGERPLSQPEAIAMAELAKEMDFTYVFAFHTQGREIYWGFQGQEPPESELLVNEFARVSDYEPVRTIDSYAGYKDWFIQNWRRPGFTVELGFGANPLPLSQFDQMYAEALAILASALFR